jgi:hypothetical protein
MFLTIFRIFHEIHNQVWETSAPAEETLRGAFWYDARPTIREWRRSDGLPELPGKWIPGANHG